MRVEWGFGADKWVVLLFRPRTLARLGYAPAMLKVLASAMILVGCLRFASLLAICSVHVRCKHGEQLILNSNEVILRHSPLVRHVRHLSPILLPKRREELTLPFGN